MTPTAPQQPSAMKGQQQRQLRRRRRQQRQTLIFGSLFAALIVVALLAISILAGVIQPPFERAFTEPALDRAEDAPPLVCAPADTLALNPDEITVHIFNGTSTMGLAQSVSGTLADSGFEVATVGNASEGLIGTARISANAQNIDRAYTVATYFNDAEVILDARPDDSVDVIIGTGFTSMANPEILDRGPGTPLVSLPYCESAEEIVPEAAPERYNETPEGSEEPAAEDATADEA